MGTNMDRTEQGYANAILKQLTGKEIRVRLYGDPVTSRTFWVAGQLKDYFLSRSWYGVIGRSVTPEWVTTCSGCGWPISWAWHKTVSGQQCRNCQPKLEIVTQSTLDEEYGRERDEWLAEQMCGTVSPERSATCHLPAGHTGAHEGERAPGLLASWTNHAD